MVWTVPEGSIWVRLRGIDRPIGRWRCCGPLEVHRYPDCYSLRSQANEVPKICNAPPGFLSSALNPFALEAGFSRSGVLGRLRWGCLINLKTLVKSHKIRIVDKTPYKPILGSLVICWMTS